jgi:hypothetical protein
MRNTPRLSFCIALVLALMAVPSVAAPGVHGNAPAKVVKFSEIVAQQLAKAGRPEPRKFIPEEEGPGPRPLPAGYRRPPNPMAAVTQSAATPVVQSPLAVATFLGLADTGTSIPPDTQGTVGAGHIMTTLNTQVRIHDKTGSAISTVSLNTFFSSVDATANVFDPNIRYDSFNDRWIFVATANPEAATSEFLIAVSQTSDPTGSWNMYKVDCDSTDINWCDYPSVGFNKNWVVVTLNMFPIAAGNYAGDDIYAFDKSKLYAGTSAAFSKFTDTGAFTLNPATTYDNSVDTMYLLQDWNGFSGVLAMSTITGAVGTESYNSNVHFPTAASTWNESGPGAPQSGSTATIDDNDTRLMSVIYRNGSLWASHTIFLPDSTATRSALQWWNISTAGNVLQLGRLDDSSAATFYSFPGMSVNKDGDVLLGFSIFSSSQFASAGYALHFHSEPDGSLQSPVQYKSGVASYNKTFGGSRNRWGDYSATAVDPANDTDFFTLQEFADTPNTFGGGSTQSAWSTWWAKVVPAAGKRRRGQTTSE